MSAPAPQPNVSFRPAVPGDARKLVALQQDIYTEDRAFVGDGPPGIESLTRRLRSLESRKSLYLVAVTPTLEDEAIVAWLKLHRLVPKKLEHVAVLTLAVAADYRRRGIAGALLRDADAWARRVGVKKISLNVRANNEAAAALYKGQGFLEEGLERAHIRLSDGFEDNLIMAKFLNYEPRT